MGNGDDNMKKLIFILTICFGVLSATAQGIKFVASAPKVVGMNERFEVSFTVNTENIGEFQAPIFKGARILSGPNQSTRRSSININGVPQNRTSIAFSYYLQPTTVGIINITPAKVKAGGTTYSSGFLAIKVEQNTPTTSKRQTTDPASEQNTRQSEVKLDEKAMFVRAIANKTNVVQGEEVILTYKLYSLVDVSQYQTEHSPVTKGFWFEELGFQKESKVSTEIFEGRAYKTGTIRKILVYPQQNGKLTIQPLAIEALANIPVNRGNKGTGDPFLDRFFDDPIFASMNTIKHQSVQKKLLSNSVTINVKPMPNVPNDYIGAVGNFSLSSSIDKTECKQGEIITLRYIISGAGNIPLIDKLPLKITQDCEVYEPTIVDEIQKDENGISGKRTFEYIIIPRKEGKITIEPLTVSFYDIEARAFRSIKSSQHNLNVAKGNDTEAMFKQRKEREKYRKKEILPLKKIDKLSNTLLNPFVRSWFWLSVFLFIALATTFVVLRRRRIENNKDIKAIRLRKANKVAIKRLETARFYLLQQDNEGFIAEISKSLWCYLEDRFGIERFDLTKERISQTLTAYEVEQTNIAALVTLLERCEMIRFSSERTSEQNEDMYDKSVIAISNLETNLKSNN